jgi:hypothetical protein
MHVSHPLVAPAPRQNGNGHGIADLYGRLRIVPSLFKLLSDRDNNSHYSILSTLALSFGWVHGGLGARFIGCTVDWVHGGFGT